jgi:hypothetical protein
MKKLLVVLMFASVVLWACKKGSESFYSTTTLMNAAIDMPAITLNLNSDTIISNVGFGSVRYNVSNPSGTYALTFTATGSTNALYSVNTGFSSGSSYTAIVYDSASPTLAANAPHLYFQKDVFPPTITNGKCSIRFFDLVPDTSASVGHIFVKIDTGTAVVYGKYYFGSRRCGDFGSYNPFAEADTTTAWLKVVRDTAATAMTTPVTLDSIKVGLGNGNIYSLFLVGAYKGTGAKKPHLIIHQHN